MDSYNSFYDYAFNFKIKNVILGGSACHALNIIILIATRHSFVQEKGCMILSGKKVTQLAVPLLTSLKDGVGLSLCLVNENVIQNTYRRRHN